MVGVCEVTLLASMARDILLFMLFLGQAGLRNDEKDIILCSRAERASARLLPDPLHSLGVHQSRGLSWLLESVIFVIKYDWITSR